LAQGIRLDEVGWEPGGERLVWLEGRSAKGVLCCSTLGADAPRMLTEQLSVRARVGYGGGDFGIARDQAIFASGGRLYAQSLGVGAAQPITPAFGQAAAPTMSPDGRWVAFVHSADGQDILAIVDLEGRLWPQKLVAGADFYMQPAWHPDGDRLAYVAWNHPAMPWDATELHLVDLACDTGLPRVSRDRVLAGGPSVSVLQPAFSPDGRFMSFLSDQSGWWGLYLCNLTGEGAAQPLWVEGAELGVPTWVQGVRTYAWSADGRRLYVCRRHEGQAQLWAVDVSTGQREIVGALAEYTHVEQVTVADGGQVAMIASSPAIPTRVVVWDPATDAVRVMARSSSETIAAEQLAAPEHVVWDSTEGDRARGLLYLSPGASDNTQEKPPLIILVHGGPTGQSEARYLGNVQFFATRGYAVLDVNYRGSSGYGRAYRNRLQGKWGLFDADDAVTGGQALAARGLVDGERMAIMGGSAGGYTVFQALIRYPGIFRAGICMYGVTNLFALASDTHKFEQHYLDSMIGPLPEAAALYRERSPIYAADRIRDPIAVFQGEEDPVVPKAQAETIVEALQRSGVPHLYHLYAGEGHGWRRSETIEAFYTSVEQFMRDHVLFS
jgi:dipeptidyl aminopeptidase/acylaminoacyl peptidase